MTVIMLLKYKAAHAVTVSNNSGAHARRVNYGN